MNDNILDWKLFLDELYKQKARQFEKSIPKAPPITNDFGKALSRSVLNNLEIIGQVDRKFIAVVEKYEKKLYFFDQHAVHERIRVEKLVKGKYCRSAS